MDGGNCGEGKDLPIWDKQKSHDVLMLEHRPARVYSPRPPGRQGMGLYNDAFALHSAVWGSHPFRAPQPPYRADGGGGGGVARGGRDPGTHARDGILRLLKV